MGLYLNQNEVKTQLSSKVAADLAQRLNKRAIESGKEPAAILQNKQKTTSGGLFWAIVVGVILVAVLTYLIFFFLT